MNLRASDIISLLWIVRPHEEFKAVYNYYELGSIKNNNGSGKNG
jgi:hypothetical protein